MFSEGTGKGCTFTISLPHVIRRSLSENKTTGHGFEVESDIEMKSRRFDSQRKRAAVDTNGISSPPARFLVVDDSAVNRKMLSKLIKSRFDCVIVEANDGLIAADLIQRELESGLHFDAVFMDSIMPHMDGPTATATCRASGYKGVIFGVTGKAREEEINSFVKSGAESVFTKPVDSELLFASIERLL